MSVLALILVFLGVAACYVPRFPAVVLSYAGLLSMYFAGSELVDSSTLLFWGIAVLLVLGIGYLLPAHTRSVAGNAYITTGAIAGTLLGFLVQPTVALLITGGFVGAVLGALAYRSTPRGLRNLPVFSSEFLNFACSGALRAVVACSICGIIAATVL